MGKRAWLDVQNNVCFIIQQRPKDSVNITRTWSLEAYAVHRQV
jgi:hypothetical protein